MISSITGELISIENGAAQIRPAGLGVVYEVLLPAYLAERFAGQTSRPITLRTFHYFESQGQGSSFLPRLVGFEVSREREFFDLLTSVSGIGNRKALRIMAIEPGRIARLIGARDLKGLRQLPEVGPKLAELIVANLHEKMTPFLSQHESAAFARTEPTGGGAVSPAMAQAAATLMALGESSAEAQRLVAFVAGERNAASADELVEAVFARRASARMK
jgi:holliday junction DNA helicase RuvA